MLGKHGVKAKNIMQNLLWVGGIRNIMQNLLWEGAEILCRNNYEMIEVYVRILCRNA